MTQLKFWMSVTKIFAVICWLILLLFLYISDANANAVLQQPFQPTSINRMVSSSSVVTASTRFAGVTAANQSVYAVRAVEIGKASVANAVRSRSFTPWGFGLVAGLTAAGYLLDEETQQINTQFEMWQSPTGGQCNQSGTDGTFGSCFQRVANLQSHRPERFPLVVTKDGNSLAIKGADRPITPALGIWTPPQGYTIPDLPSYVADTAPVSDDALFDVFRNLSPSQQTDLLSDPLTGFPDASNVPEFQQAADQISSNWNANNDGDPNTTPEPDATEQTSEEPFPEEQPEQDICKANPEFLACQELGETPDETPIGEQELPFDYQPVSFSGNASCPASIQMGGGIQYDYDAACSFASGVKPAVITMALLTGVFVMGGFRR